MIKEVGIWRIVKYLVFGLWDVVFRLLPWSPARVLWMRLFGADVELSAVVEKVIFMNLDRAGLGGLRIGRRCFLGSGAVIDLAGRLEISDHSTVSPAAVILSHFSVGFGDHPLIARYPKKIARTVLGEGCFIGANSTVLAGVNIGKKSMIAAGAVVARDVPDGVMVAGVPAKTKS